jgi:DNA primase large subunit
MESKVRNGRLIKLLNSLLNREKDIKRIILYLDEQLRSNIENQDKFDAYNECIHLLYKWINHQEIKEIKKFTNTSLDSIRQREEQQKLWTDFLANHAITERGLAIRAELQQAVQRVRAKMAHEKKG